MSVRVCLCVCECEDVFAYVCVCVDGAGEGREGGAGMCGGRLEMETKGAVGSIAPYGEGWCHRVCVNDVWEGECKWCVGRRELVTRSYDVQQLGPCYISP